MTRPRRHPSERIAPGHGATRGFLRSFGLLLTVAGGLCVLVAGVDFFSAFGGVGPPTKFWLFFVGLPLLGAGTAMLRLGFAGAIARYHAAELTPVATDTARVAVDEAEDALRRGARAVGEGLGLRPGRDGHGRTCGACGALADASARFCDACGAPLATACRACGAANDGDARFCDQCGTALPAPGGGS